MRPAPATADIRLKGPTDYVVTRLLDDGGLARLAAEAFERGEHASTSLRDSLDGDRPSVHCLETADGGPVLGAFFGGQATLDAIARLTGRAWRWVHFREFGNYNYYRQPYHFNGLHRDREFCELSVVTCIHDDSGPGGDLVLFPGRCEESLPAIRATPEEGAVWLRLHPGESLVMCGHAVAHAVTPVAPGQTRITAAACYQAVDR
jgi:hypothetical protein